MKLFTRGLHRKTMIKLGSVCTAIAIMTSVMVNGSKSIDVDRLTAKGDTPMPSQLLADIITQRPTVSEEEIVTTVASTTIVTTTTNKTETTTTTEMTSTSETTTTTVDEVIDDDTVDEETTVVEENTEESTDEVVTVEETVTDVDVDTNEEKVCDEYIVYKPSTHYVHKSTCRWSDSTCYEITSTNDIEARKCSECNPNIDIVSEYVESTPVIPNTSDHTALSYVTEEERIMLCNVVGGEYGSDWVSLYDKACVVACVMNRYYDGGWQGYGRANTIYNVITAPGQFAPQYGNTSYNWNVTDSCIQAVDYYFENMGSFPHYTSFWGDGSRNHFS